MPDHGTCCTKQCRQPRSDCRKKVSGLGKSSRESADCLPGSPHESPQRARQLVEATAAALTDPPLLLLSTSGFSSNAHNRKSARRPLLPSQQESRGVPP